MAGSPGRSGGRRPGAGRPRKSAAAEHVSATLATPAPIDAVPQPAPSTTSTPAPTDPAAPPAVTETPLDYMLRVMNDRSEDPDMRARMAMAAAPYVHGKVGEQGKKAQKQEAAEKTQKAGRFATPAPPPGARRPH